MYAHVTDGIVDNMLGSPPRYEFQDGRWWDLRPRDLATLATVGWYPVQEVAKPSDTATTTWEPVFTFDAGVVTQSWNEIAKTADQLQAELENNNYAALIAKAEVALQANIADIPAIQTLASGNGFASNTQRDAAIRGLAARVLTLHRQNNALIRVVAGLLASQDGS